MKHSKKFDLVKEFYDYRLWSKTRVWNAVGRWITAEEYEEITGEPYVPANTNEEKAEESATDTNVGGKE